MSSMFGNNPAVGAVFQKWTQPLADRVAAAGQSPSAAPAGVQAPSVGDVSTAAGTRLLDRNPYAASRAATTIAGGAGGSKLGGGA